jgi:hypothetical protein
MKLPVVCAALAVAWSSVSSSGATVYIISSGDVGTDSAAAGLLSGAGYQVQVGVQFSVFDGTVDLTGVSAVYLQNNFNWSSGGIMPAAGAQQLIGWVNGGGRLVTSEWVVYYTYAGGRFGGLDPIIPAVNSFSYSGNTIATMTVVTADAAIDAGLPTAFTCPLVSYTGTETFTVAKPGATTYFSTSSSANAAALVGWTVGSGRVYSFLSTCGPAQLADANFGRLFTNVFGGQRCGSADFDCDGDVATDADIESFFRCLAGNCPAPPCGSSADFNADGDSATDADIEAFFRVLAGGTC